MKDKVIRKSLAEIWEVCIPFNVYLGQQVPF
jgi:hypothetical protein